MVIDFVQKENFSEDFVFNQETKQFKLKPGLTPTDSEQTTKEISISQEANNILEKKDDGFYVQGLGVQGPIGPEGPQGPRGKNGLQGEPGQPGQNGSDGKSAYDIWLGLGNTGSEQDFINQLKGPNESSEIISRLETLEQAETPKVDYSRGNVLYGKKWCAYGDSYTEGLSWNFDKPAPRGQKAYPYWIGKRNGMTVANHGVSGSWLVQGALQGTECFSLTPTQGNKGTTHYTEIPADADYITLAFGLNESDIGTKTDGSVPAVGTKEDRTNTTLWGAYYVVFNKIFSQNHKARVGVILQDGWMKEPYRAAVKEICAAWGVPVLDLKDPSVPMRLTSPTVDKDRTLARARQLRANPFTESNHPTDDAHEQLSTVVEHFLRQL